MSTFHSSAVHTPDRFLLIRSRNTFCSGVSSDFAFKIASKSSAWVCRAEGFEQSKSTPPLSVRNPSKLLQQPVQQEEQAVLRGSQQAGSTQKLDTDVWSYKPAWCQPYTIIGTGLAVIGGMWGFTGGSMVWTAAGSVPVIAWWYLFLIIYPAQFKEYAEGINTERQEH